MSFGVVPVTTNVGSISEIVKEKDNGLFVQVKDSITICQQIVILNSDRNLLQHLSQNAKEYIIKHFNEQEYINKLNKIYTKATT